MPASRLPSTASSSRNWTDWNPLARSSRPRKLENPSGVIVSSTSIWATIVFRIVRIRFIVMSAEPRSPLASRSCEPLQLVQEHLEPELVHLVDDDEEHLVVLGAVRERLLAGEQVVQVQVRRVGDGGMLGGGHGPNYRTAASGLASIPGRSRRCGRG